MSSLFFCAIYTTAGAWMGQVQRQKWVWIDSGKGKARHCNAHHRHCPKRTKYASNALPPSRAAIGTSGKQTRG